MLLCLSYSIGLFIDSKNIKSKVDDISCELVKTNNNVGCGIHIMSESEHQIEMELDVSLQLNRKDIKPLFNVDKNEGDK